MAIRVVRLGTPRAMDETRCHRSVLKALLAEHGALA